MIVSGIWLVGFGLLDFRITRSLVRKLVVQSWVFLKSTSPMSSHLPARTGDVGKYVPLSTQGTDGNKGVLFSNVKEDRTKYREISKGKRKGPKKSLGKNQWSRVNSRTRCLLRLEILSGLSPTCPTHLFKHKDVQPTRKYSRFRCCRKKNYSRFMLTECKSNAWCCWGSRKRRYEHVTVEEGPDKNTGIKVRVYLMGRDTGNTS